MLQVSSPPQPSLAGAHADDRLRTRIQSEFREMPGLILTLPQAARLFSLDVARCERILGALVDEGCLATNGKTFAMASGRA